MQLSATALTTYQQCPYKFKLKYLVRIPEAQSPLLIYGSAVHKSLELFFKQIKGALAVPSLKELLTIYYSVLARQPLAESEKRARRQQGEQVLTAYYRQHKDEFPTPLFVERWFGGQFSPIFLGQVPLVGKVDRVDLLDSTKKTVRIVDYKTGRPKSYNEILGQTAAGDNSQLTQLLFYKLIAELDRSFEYEVVELQLDFIEGPSKDHSFKRPSVAASPQQMVELKDSIQSVFEQIKALNFDRTTDYRVCDGCPFHYHCWPEGIPQIKPEQLTLA